MNQNQKAVSILLVEDSEEDVFFFRRTLSRCQAVVNLTVVNDGQAALDLLAQPGRISDFDVMFLDLKLPLFDGFEVLAVLRSRVEGQHLPVYVLSGSPQARDRERAAQLGATGYLVKPITRDVLLRYLPCFAIA